MTTLLALCCALATFGQNDSLLIVFWNLENFYDWQDEGGGQSDSEFTPDGIRRWTPSRFYRKCNAISKVICRIADKYGRFPDAIGFCEVENRSVLSRLIGSTLLGKLDYGIVHYESPDRRGMDCALIYRKSSLDLISYEAKHLYDSCGRVMPTRDILAARFDRIALLVNHHPSKVGPGGESGRSVAMSLMNRLCDSLSAAGCSRILSIGDFNDDVWEKGGEGTIKYHGRWEKIDGYFAFGTKKIEESVYADSSISVQDNSYGGYKPLRTYSGLRYLGGISDHRPIAFVIH